MLPVERLEYLALEEMGTKALDLKPLENALAVTRASTRTAQSISMSVSIRLTQHSAALCGNLNAVACKSNVDLYHGAAGQCLCAIRDRKICLPLDLA